MKLKKDRNSSRNEMAIYAGTWHVDLKTMKLVRGQRERFLYELKLHQEINQRMMISFVEMEP